MAPELRFRAGWRRSWGVGGPAKLPSTGAGLPSHRTKEEELGRQRGAAERARGWMEERVRGRGELQRGAGEGCFLAPPWVGVACGRAGEEESVRG